MANVERNVVTVDVGGTGYRVAGVAGGEIKTRIYTSRHLSPEDPNRALRQLRRYVAKVAREMRHHGDGTIFAAAVGMPNPSDYEQGTLRATHKPNLAPFCDISLPYVLQPALSLPGQQEVPIAFMDDGDALGQGAESLYPDEPRLMVVGLGTGLGASFRVNGKPATTEDGAPPLGEIYDLPFRDGILEDYVSRDAILTAYPQAGGNKDLDVKDIAELARQKDGDAVDALNQFAVALGEGLAMVSSLFNPTRIVIGGNIAGAMDVIRDTVKTTYNDNYDRGENVPISVLNDSDRLPLLGAANHALEKFYIPEKSLVDTTYDQALAVMKKSANDYGFSASASFEHYTGVWARDACISIPGALLTGDPDLIKAAKATLETLTLTQSEKGQIGVGYWPATAEKEAKWNWGETGATDATALFIAATAAYVNSQNDTEFAKKMWPKLQKAFEWLTYQDANNSGLVDSPEGADWMDSTFVRGGKILFNNVLFYRAAVAMDQLGERVGEETTFDTEGLKTKINTLFWPSPGQEYADLWNQPNVEFPATMDKAYKHAIRRSRHTYISHVNYGNFVDKADVLGNVMAIMYGVADKEQTKKILDSMKAQGVSDPYPSRTYPKPVTLFNNKHGMLKTIAERFQSRRWRNPANNYHNGAIWPFIGGLHIVALCQAGRVEEAENMLEKLAAANNLGTRENNFYEWINPRKRKVGGAAHQTWNAATYIEAYQAVQEARRAREEMMRETSPSN